MRLRIKLEYGPVILDMSEIQILRLLCLQGEHHISVLPGTVLDVHATHEHTRDGMTIRESVTVPEYDE